MFDLYCFLFKRNVLYANSAIYSNLSAFFNPSSKLFQANGPWLGLKSGTILNAALTFNIFSTIFSVLAS